MKEFDEPDFGFEAGAVSVRLFSQLNDLGVTDQFLERLQVFKVCIVRINAAEPDRIFLEPLNVGCGNFNGLGGPPFSFCDYFFFTVTNCSA